jgi:tetratricopeptide (TPR) repeat protein
MGNLATVLVEEGAFAEAGSLYRQALAAGTRIFKQNAEMAGWNAGLGWLLFNQGKAAEADRLFQRSLEICHARIGSGSVREARILDKYVVVETAMGNYDRAEADIERGLEIYRNKLGASPMASADLLFHRAQVAWKRGRNSKADDLFRQALDLDRAAGRAAQLQMATHLIGYAGFLASTGNAIVAEPLAREAVEIRVRDLPAGFWTIETARSSLGATLTALGRYAEAEPLVVPAYTELNRKLGRQARDSQSALERVVRLYEAWGKPEEAQSYRAPRRAAAAGAS